jgi:3-hydroxyisobutyrate dehydrogenase-like beta-hydroxyacid dehydrogenase
MTSSQKVVADTSKIQKSNTKATNSLGNVGLVGLGNVGQHYARHLLRVSDLLSVYDIDPSKASQIVSAGGVAASSSCELAAASDSIVLALPNPLAVEAEMFGEKGIFAAERKNCLVIDISTIDPDTSKRLYSEAKSRGYDYLEAPMSGGEPGGSGVSGAKAGTVTFMAGGDVSSFERAKPVLDVLGSHAIHLGPAGSGNTVKLISNMIAGLNMAVMAEGFVLGAAAGISHDILLEVFSRTDAKSYTMFEEFAPHLSANDYEDGFPIDLMHKDHRLAGELGQKFGVPLLFNQLALEVYQICRAQGYGRKSHAVVIEALAGLANVKLFNKDKKAGASPI